MAVTAGMNGSEGIVSGKLELRKVDFAALKPSDYLEAMVVGLRRNAEDSRTRVNMTTFGWIEDDLCFGCAATMGLSELFGVLYADVAGSLSPESKNRSWVKLVQSTDGAALGVALPSEMDELETVFDWARRGSLSPLRGLAGWCFKKSRTRYDLSQWCGLWSLTTENWKQELPKVEKAIAEMRAAGR